MVTLLKAPTSNKRLGRWLVGWLMEGIPPGRLAALAWSTLLPSSLRQIQRSGDPSADGLSPVRRCESFQPVRTGKQMADHYPCQTRNLAKDPKDL